jgi:hypothetical protein
MRNFLWRWVLVLILVCLPVASRADIASSTVIVEFLEKQTKITPGDPTINLAASPSVIIEIQPGDNTFRVTPILARASIVDAARAAKSEIQTLALERNALLAKLNDVIENPSDRSVTETIQQLDDAKGRTTTTGEKAALEKAKTELSTAAAGATVSSNRVLLNFHRGWYYEYKRNDIPPADQRDRAAALADAGWDIWLRNRHYAFDFPVEIECVDSAKAKCLGTQKRLLIIHVDTASWAVTASAGVLFAGLRDERYRVDASSHLVRVNSEGDIPYYVASYLHYCPINGLPVLSSFCPTLAIGTNVPSTGVVFGLGIAGHLKPLASINSAYLSVGGVYGPRKTLSDTYLGQTQPITVPANTSAASVLTTHYAFRWFAGISLGITADVDKFRGLYSGGKASGSETKPAP